MAVTHVFFISIFFILIFTTAGSQVRELTVDIKRNLSLPCKTEQSKNVMWIRDGRIDGQIRRLSVQEDGSLFFTRIDRNDSGIYTCAVEGSDTVQAKYKVKVRTPPPALFNVTVHPSTVLALILWQVRETGGYPIIRFTAQYRLANSDENWKPISPNHISPNSRQIDIYKLQPNTTYAFRIWGTNQLGMGEITEIEGKTLFIDQELELARHLLSGADKFDTRVWLVAVAVVMGTLLLLGFGTCFLLYQECRTPSEPDDQEIIELVPNIILNPGFEANSYTEHIPPDENSNHETTLRLNNNTVIQPRNM